MEKWRRKKEGNGGKGRRKGRAAWWQRERWVMDERLSRTVSLGGTWWDWLWGLSLRGSATVPGARHCGTGWFLDSVLFWDRTTSEAGSTVGYWLIFCARAILVVDFLLVSLLMYKDCRARAVLATRAL